MHSYTSLFYLLISTISDTSWSSVEEVLEMTLPLLFSGIGFESFHSLGGRQRKHLNHWGIIGDTHCK